MNKVLRYKFFCIGRFVQSKKRGQIAYKPGSVQSQKLFDDYSSRLAVTCQLMQPTRTSGKITNASYR